MSSLVVWFDVPSLYPRKQVVALLSQFQYTLENLGRTGSAVTGPLFHYGVVRVSTYRPLPSRVL